jgi:hypothetical protein
VFVCGFSLKGEHRTIGTIPVSEALKMIMEHFAVLGKMFSALANPQMRSICQCQWTSHCVLAFMGCLICVREEIMTMGECNYIRLWFVRLITNKLAHLLLAHLFAKWTWRVKCEKTRK